jgi:glutathionylspermidine synthase
MKKTKLSIKPDTFLKNSGWDWTNTDISPYISDELVQVSENEADKYYQAGVELYELFIKAAEFIIKNKKYDLLDIPKGLIPLIEYTWEHDNHWHLYGRFDLSGGLNGQQIKLIEFNADTATCLPETAVVQWASLIANGLDESFQFNTVLEGLTSTFKTLKNKNPDKTPTILLSSMAGFPEDATNVSILQEAAQQAGFQTDTEFIENVEFSKSEGIFKEISQDNFEQYPYWFKLVPWEFIANDEPELLEIITELVLNNKLIVINPAYTLIFQSKGLLKILWDLFPNHLLLLETKFEPLYGQKSVKKVFFGREGANVQFISSYGTALTNSNGEYSHQKAVYQAFTEFLSDEKGDFYQAGLFFSSEPCGLGFRKGREIIDNTASFCGHHIV